MCIFLKNCLNRSVKKASLSKIKQVKYETTPIKTMINVLAIEGRKTKPMPMQRKPIILPEIKYLKDNLILFINEIFFLTKQYITTVTTVSAKIVEIAAPILLKRAIKNIFNTKLVMAPHTTASVNFLS